MTVYVDTRTHAAILNEKYYLLNKHLPECYQRIERKENINGLIRQHKRLISQLQINSKKIPKTLTILQNYANHKDKLLGFSTLTNTLNNRGVFSM